MTNETAYFYACRLRNNDRHKCMIKLGASENPIEFRQKTFNTNDHVAEMLRWWPWPRTLEHSTAFAIAKAGGGRKIGHKKSEEYEFENMEAFLRAYDDYFATKNLEYPKPEPPSQDGGGVDLWFPCTEIPERQLHLRLTAHVFKGGVAYLKVCGVCKRELPVFFFLDRVALSTKTLAKGKKPTLYGIFRMSETNTCTECKPASQVPLVLDAKGKLRMRIQDIDSGRGMVEWWDQQDKLSYRFSTLGLRRLHKGPNLVNQPRRDRSYKKLKKHPR